MSQPIFFWSMPEFKCFSNFHPLWMTIDGKLWPTVEHYFQAMKTDNFEQQEMIRKANTPKEAKALGRKVDLCIDWEEMRYGIMLKALRIKFGIPREGQESLTKILTGTGDRPIYEDSKYDTTWGTGVLGGIGNGKNLLGKALMRVRRELQNNGL